MNNITAHISLSLHARVSLRIMHRGRTDDLIVFEPLQLPQSNAKLFSQLIVFLPVIYKTSDYSTVSPTPGLVLGIFHLSLAEVERGLMSNIHSLASFSLLSFRILLWLLSIKRLQHPHPVKGWSGRVMSKSQCSSSWEMQFSFWMTWVNVGYQNTQLKKQLEIQSFSTFCLSLPTVAQYKKQ